MGQVRNESDSGVDKSSAPAQVQLYRYLGTYVCVSAWLLFYDTPYVLDADADVIQKLARAKRQKDIDESIGAKVRWLEK